MPICQISPFGGQPKWQKIGLKEFPDTEKLILIANSPDYETMNFIEQAHVLKKEIEMEQQDYPEKYKVKISVLDVTNILHDYYQLLSYMRQLFQYLISMNYQIIINGTSGLQLIQMVLYQMALIFKDNVKAYFIYNKITNKRQEIWIQQQLNENENTIIKILNKEGEISVSKLQEEFQKIMEKGSLSYIVKIIQNLVRGGILEELKIGRIKYVKLSRIGNALVGIEDWTVDLKKLLK